MIDIKDYISPINISDKDIKAVVGAMEEKDISLPFGATQRLEDEISDFFGIKYALAHCNGTSAMQSAMYGIGIKKEDEIICPSYTWWASIAPAFVYGARPVVCEINADNLTIDSADIKKKISKKTKAIVVPHLWGNFGNVLEINKILKKYSRKIYIIEDVSHALGASINKRYLGTLGDVGIFSMQASKVLTAGEGGMLITDNKDIYERAVFLGHQKRIKNLNNKKILRYKETGGGFKFRIHPLGAALALSQLSTLKKRISRQNELCSYFESKLREIHKIRLFNKNPSGFKRGGIINIKGKIIFDKFRKNEQIKKLAGLFIKKDYFTLLHREPLFTGSRAKFTGNGALPESEKIHKGLYSFPVFYRGNKKVIDEYCREIHEILC